MKFWHTIKCKLNLHAWVCRDSLNSSFNYHNRSCKYCSKYQYKRGKGKWVTRSIKYETATKVVHKSAEALSKTAVTISDELAKFDNHKKQKTRALMNLLYLARGLSNDYTRLKKDIRQLHIRKQLSDIAAEKNNT